jgi:hypothetical protein
MAYRRFNENVTVCLPLPLNWIVRWARQFYFWVIIAQPDLRERYEGALAHAEDLQKRCCDLEVALTKEREVGDCWRRLCHKTGLNEHPYIWK